MTEIHLMTKGHKYWKETISLAERCSWKADPFLARRMQGNGFKEWERVCAVCENGKVAGFSTFTERDEVSWQEIVGNDDSTYHFLCGGAWL